jgi:hypothetical protein
MPQLLATIAPFSRIMPAAAKQVDLPFARKVESVPVKADERTRRRGQITPANRAAKQPMAGP